MFDIKKGGVYFDFFESFLFHSREKRGCPLIYPTYIKY